MHLFSTVATLLLVSIFFPHPLTAFQLGDMEPLYTFTPGPEPGNCDQYKENLKTGFSEGTDMLQRSVAAIKSLAIPLPGKELPKERAAWKTWAQLLKAGFNIQASQKTGLDINILPVTDVINNFTAMITRQNYQPPSSLPGQYWFFCDDTFIKWTEPIKAVLDSLSWPDDGGKTRANVEKNGYWNFTGGTPENPYFRFQPGWEGQDKTSYKCSGDEIAFMTDPYDPRAITFCPRLFRSVTPTAAQLKQKYRLLYGAKLANLATYGTIMTHEWGHLINGLIDEPAVNEAGDPLYKGSTRIRELVYGWDKVVWKAKNQPEGVRKTPDAYTQFAMAVYYTEINGRGLQFSSGLGLDYGEVLGSAK